MTPTPPPSPPSPEPQDRPRRDRDAAGRPRNARLRDAAGRPLPRGAVTGAVERPAEEPLAPAQALAAADDYLAADRPFAAHEVLEARWKAAPAQERDAWRGLAQLAVGLVHVQRGNAVGAAALLRRGAEGLEAAVGAGAVPAEVEAITLAATVRDMASTVERSGCSAVRGVRLRLRSGR